MIEVREGEQKSGFDVTLMRLSDSEVGAAVPPTRSAVPPPVDTRPLFSPQLFPRRGPRPVLFPLLKGS